MLDFKHWGYYQTKMKQAIEACKLTFLEIT
jgi:hypothetical protein